MRRFKQWFFFMMMMVFCFLLVSCRATRQVSKTEEQSTKTIERRTQYRDTVLYTQKAQAQLKIPISELKKCPDIQKINAFETALKSDLKQQIREKEKPKIWKQKNGNATSTIKIIHDSIFVSAQCDSLSIVAKIKQDIYKETSDKKEKEKINTDTKPNIFEGILVVFSVFFFGVVLGFILKTLLKITI